MADSSPAAKSLPSSFLKKKQKHTPLPPIAEAGTGSTPGDKTFTPGDAPSKLHSPSPHPATPHLDDLLTAAKALWDKGFHQQDKSLEHYKKKAASRLTRLNTAKEEAEGLRKDVEEEQGKVTELTQQLAAAEGRASAAEDRATSAQLKMDELREQNRQYRKALNLPEETEGREQKGKGKKGEKQGTKRDDKSGRKRKREQSGETSEKQKGSA